MYRQDDPQINIDQILEKFKKVFGRFGGTGKGVGPVVVLLIIAIAIAGWLATGIFTVQPGEKAALKMFGKYSQEVSPGLSWWWPSPIGDRDVVRVDAVRKLELGVRNDVPVLDESLMITGDPDELGAPGEAPNLVDVQLTVQYEIKNIRDYLYKVVSPDGTTLKDATETSLRQVVGGRPIDDVLTDKKQEVEIATKNKLQEILDYYQSGLNIREVKLLNVFAPEQVKDAFDDVVRAKEDKARIINLADAYKESVLPAARGESSKRLQDAEGLRQQKIAEANGEAGRFTAIQREYSKSKDITRKRMYLEAMEEILPNINKVLGDPSQVILVNPESNNVIPVPTQGVGE
ncbi:MAG: FtsH protease activity modulator HflK [Dehalococcoidia bacterium]